MFTTVFRPQITKIKGIMSDLPIEAGLSFINDIPRLISITRTTHTQKGVLLMISKIDLSISAMMILPFFT
ncbi:2-oxoglutarate dehydrogenase E1 component [Leuconostoc suionicum]|nr:2-oxoglutarate dehydrogenase E1 component [Leuconostoc suionicum]